MPLLAELTPTGNAVAWDFIHIRRIADGSIVEHSACRDDVGLLAQVGGRPRSRWSGCGRLCVRTPGSPILSAPESLHDAVAGRRR
jgi:SnoaL-like polyketide cyclase